MGGAWSGRYGRRSSRLCVEDVITLDLGVVIRPTLRAARTAAYATLSVSGGQLVRVFVDLRAASMSIEYPNGRAETAPLVPLVQPFGGVRWLASCPRCGRRCRKLNLPTYPGAALACRRCHQLVYRCQRIATGDRWRLRAARLQRKVAIEDEDTGYRYKRKWLRWSTFNRVLDQADEYDGASIGLALQGFMRSYG
jgi:hypothetical protein